MITRLFILRRSSLRFLPPVAAFLFSAIAGISVAAWLDAPNAPPNYGLTPPYTQDDFKPMNLGTAPQVKNAGVEFIGGVTATHFVDGNSPYFTDASLPLYQLDLANSDEAGLVKGRLGIGATSTQAKLTVNNPATQDKWGSMSDAIYAYADNSIYGMSTVLSLEQGSPTGYALYSSGGINYFGGDVKVGSATSPKSLCINDDCKTAWPSGVWTVSGNDIYNNNTGNVGIGTASPQANLHVGGSARIDGPANTCKKISYSNTTSYQIGHAGGADSGSGGDPYAGGYPRAAPASTTSCGVNYYVISAMDASGHFGNPATPPSSGSLLCCKNAD